MRHGPKWDARFMAVAADVASWSKDSCKVGAVLVSPDGHQVSWGYNGLPVALNDDDRREYDSSAKKQALSVHAELNALANCAVKPVGWHLFVTKAPCTPCALTLMQFGVSRIVSPPIIDGSSWAESQYLARSLFRTAGVSAEEYEI